MTPHSFNNLIVCCQHSCQNSKDVSNADSSFNILEHQVFTAVPCVKKVTKTLTTYRDHYCGRKWAPKAQKICPPYPALHVSGEKLSARSTYTDDFHSYSAKDRQDSRGTAVAQRHSLSCEKKTFGGKSETKAAFRRSYVGSKPSGTVSPLKEIGKFNEKQPFTATSTYSSEFKKPKKYEKVVDYAPKPNISVSKEPFQHISQYKNEFRMPKDKKGIPEHRSRKFTFQPPSVSMESMTTYKASFTFKTPTSKPRARVCPDHGCEECKISINQQRAHSDENSDGKYCLCLDKPSGGSG